jgi:hypothetical protein
MILSNLKWRPLLFLLGIFLAGGCQNQAENVAVEVRIIKRSDLCRISKPSLLRLQGTEELSRLIAQDTLLQAQRQPMPRADFTNHYVMLLAMGQQPSTGFHIEMDPGRARIEQGTLQLPVRFLPPEGEAAATMVTSPCIVFSVKREGLQKIVAGDTGLDFLFY